MEETSHPDPAPEAESPHPIETRVAPSDRVFRGLVTGAGAVTLALVGLIAAFILVEALPALRVMGWKFLTTTQWAPESERPLFGVAAMLYGTVVIAVVALTIAIPVSVATAVFINEYAPRRARRALTSVVDLMAAIPSLIFGMWGVYFLQPRLFGFQEWLADHLGGAIPIFRVRPGATLGSSLFNAGIVVSLMVIPIATSVIREVLAQTPRGECEAALALGGTRWGMVRRVILPFGRAGMIGASMLGLGRALGETIAVTLVLSFSFRISPRVLESGGSSIASVIALSFGESTRSGVQALMAAGLALFALTLMVNVLAAVVVARSRTGAGVEL